MVGGQAPLFVPADRRDRFAKAAASGADADILDLEDAVAAADKDYARSYLVGQPMSVRALSAVRGAG